MAAFAGLMSLTRSWQLVDISSGFVLVGIENKKRDTPPDTRQ
jgi:hypothetical protein